MYGAQNTQTALASSTADDLLWAKLTLDSAPELAHAAARITFVEHASPRPLRAAIDLAAQHAPAGARQIVVAGRSRRMAVESHRAELQELGAEKKSAAGAPGGEVAKTLGDVACGFVAAGSGASLLVVQAAR